MTELHYPSPRDFRRAAEDRLKAAAKREGVPVNDLRRQWVMQCYLARVFFLPASPWILKGGAGLLMRYPKARHTRDLDLYHPTTTRLDDSITELVAAGRPCGQDPFVFEVTRKDRLTGNAEGIRLTVACRLGTKVFEEFPIDLSTRLETIGRVECIPARRIIDIPDVAAPPPVRLYPLVDQIADKVAGMYETHGSRGSSRHRDLVDLVIVTTNLSASPVDVTELRTALVREEARREGLTLPPAMTDPGLGWAGGYQAEARRAGVEPHDLEAALQLVATLIDTALDRNGHSPLGNA